MERTIAIKRSLRPLYVPLAEAYHSLRTAFYSRFRQRKYADVLYYEAFGRQIDWKHPWDLNEWIQFLQFKTDTREWSRLADKYAVREFVRERGCQEILVPLYGKWDKAEDIDYSILPDQFVLKTNHGAGCTIVVKEKRHLDRDAVAARLSTSLSQTFGLYSAEPHYRRIKRCIIAEQYLDNGPHGLIDYKIWCFGGKPYCIFTVIDRFADVKYACYTLDWQRRDDWLTDKYRNDVPVPPPLHLGRMLSYAAILSEGFPEVRVDFYEVDGHIYFGEMTFTSGCGRMCYFTPECLSTMGKLVAAAIKVG